jgi:hypothetical protein
MSRRTLNVYYRDGYPTRVVADDPSLRDVEINIINNDAPERLAFVAMVAEAEIERFCTDQRVCRSNTQWHGLSIAVEYVGETLISLRDQHYGDPAALNAAIDDVLARFNAARAQALELRNPVDESSVDPVTTARAQLAPERQAVRKTSGKTGNGGHKAIN